MKEFDKFIEGLQFLRTLLVEDDSFVSSFPFTIIEDTFFVNGLDLSHVTLEQANRLLELGFRVTKLWDDENYDDYFVPEENLLSPEQFTEEGWITVRDSGLYSGFCFNI